MRNPTKLKHLIVRRQPVCRSLCGALALTLLFLLVACKSQPASNGNPTAQSSPTTTTAQTPAVNTAFDGQRAFEHVRKQVEFGPRPAGSAELARTRDYIVGELKSYGLEVALDEFNPSTPIGERRMVNVTAVLPGETGEVILLASHYDTKLFKEFRFVGANDSGSSTGAVLELARVLATSGSKSRFTYWFVFFDGEEAFCENWDSCSKPGAPDNTYGSRHYVDQLRQKGELQRVRAMILLDMVGHKNLELGQDAIGTPWMHDIIWQTARSLGHGKHFVDRTEEVGDDDHRPFLSAGIEAVDLIQLDTFAEWHKPGDTLDIVSPQSLKTVGDVVINSLPRIEQRLASRRSGG